jgi:hypothetical protein
MVIAKTDCSNPETPHIPLLPRVITKRFMAEVRRGEK